MPLRQSERPYHPVIIPLILQGLEVVETEGQCPTSPTNNHWKKQTSIPVRTYHAEHDEEWELDQHILTIGPILTLGTYYEYPGLEVRRRQGSH